MSLSLLAYNTAFLTEKREFPGSPEFLRDSHLEVEVGGVAVEAGDGGDALH